MRRLCFVGWIIFFFASFCCAAHFITNFDGDPVQITVDLSTGLCDYSVAGSRLRINSCRAGIKFSENSLIRYVTDYPKHTIVNAGWTVIQTPHGRARQIVIRHTGDGLPTLEQIFTLYPGKPWLLMELLARSDRPLRSNWIAPLICDSSREIVSQSDSALRILEAPYDNDDWHWYRTQLLSEKNHPVHSHEFSAIYDPATNAGIIIGSITHDFWKTGIDFSADDQKSSLMVYGGASTEDVQPHGAMVGNEIISPTIFLGFFADIRQGFGAYAKANAEVAPPLRWRSGVPFGWMTFGALGANFRPPEIIATSDFIHQHLQSHNFHDADGAVCIILDGNSVPWNRAMIRAAVEHIHQNHQKAGCYMSPFCYWGGGDDQHLEKISFSNTTLAQVVLRDQQSKPISHKAGEYTLDVTHPAVMHSILWQIDRARAVDFDYFKLDFLSDGLMEGRHFDPNIRTGMQAYNQAMRAIVQRVGTDKFISLSIAPLFPSQYGDSRRISCDLYSQLNDHTDGFRPFGSTQYLLNCVTWSYWTAGALYPFNDPDEMAMYKFHDAQPIPVAWARSRVTASIVCGGNFVDCTDFAIAGGAVRVEQVLTEKGIDAIAREGVAFTPLMATHMDEDTADTFYRPRGHGLLLALFNFDANHSRTANVHLADVGLHGGKVYVLHDLWGHRTIGVAGDSVRLSIPPGDAILAQIDR